MAGEVRDFQWLVSEAAAPYLAKVPPDAASFAAAAVGLRRELGLTRAHLVLQQVKLRQRARRKFSRADRMFFTPRLLEQATDESVAAHKAARLSPGARVADLCCGAGGDLLAMAARGPCLGVDRDPVATTLAAANCRALDLFHVELQTTDAEPCDVSACDAWHIDPDRRATGRRTTIPQLFCPDLHALNRLIARNANAAVKLAPATLAPREWSEAGELEWIGDRRECRQQVVWLGTTARCAGKRTATVLAAASPPASFTGSPDVPLPVATAVGRYLFEPRPAVLAAHLTGALGAQLGLDAVDPRVAYLTGDCLVASPLVAAFEVLDVLPLDHRRLLSLLRQRRIGRLEVKARGRRVDLDLLRRKLRVPGEEAATLLVAGTSAGTLAILARRRSGSE